MSLPIELTVCGIPVSQQTRYKERREEWKQEVRDAAQRAWGEEPSAAGPFMVTITCVHDGKPFDVDNVPKPILDALKQVIFSDDSLVTDLLCRKREMSGDLRLETPLPALSEALVRGRPFVHILVDLAPDQEVITW